MIFLFAFLAIIISLVCWLIFSPIIIQFDTRVPKAELRWISIGKVLLWYEGEWWLSFRILFFRKKISLASISISPKKIEKKRRQKTNRALLLRKMFRVLKIFRIQEWQLSIDTGNYLYNAWLYPVNFLPYSYGHLYINFNNENYFFIKVRSSPWKMIYAYLR